MEKRAAVTLLIMMLTAMTAWADALAGGEGEKDGEISSPISGYTDEDDTGSYGALTITREDDGLIAAFDGTALGTIAVTYDIKVNAVTFNRTFTPGTASTVMLPFTLNAGGQTGQTQKGGRLYKFTGVEKVDGQWQAKMTETATLHANTPYLFMPNSTLIDGHMTFDLNGGTVTLNTTTEGVSSVGESVKDDWEFLGSYAERHWYDGSDPSHPAENADEIGKVYGFAANKATATDGITELAAGRFDILGSGAWLRPLRCYLKYKGEGNPLATTARNRAAAEELPKTISVILVSATGTPTEIGIFTLGHETDNWYTLDGRKLNGKPTKKGLYMVNNKKVVIK